MALIAIKGSLKEASLPDVIQLLFLGRRTGCLALADRHNFGTIYLDEGQITFATIVNRRDRLGDLLIRTGRISAEQLRQAIAAQEDDRGHKLGEILVGLGILSRAELEDYMRLQIEEAVYYLFTWTSGTFNFEAGVRPESEDFLVRISPEALLLEGARRVDEWSLIEKKIPSFDLIFSVDQDHISQSAPTLSPEQQRLLPLIEGTRDVRQLIDESGLVEFEVGKALFGLITAGFAHRVGTSTAAAPKANNSRVEEHRNLGIAFYKAGMLEEALREFRRVTDLRPSDSTAPLFLGLIAIRQARWDEAAEALRHASDNGVPRPAALHNLGFALEQLGRLDEAEAAYGDAAGRARDDARIMLGWSIVALKRGDNQVAQSRLVQVRQLLNGKPVPALWYWASSLASSGLDDANGALQAARDGVEAYPNNAVLQNNLAVLLELNGDIDGAEAMLRAALAEDPALPQVSKNLADILYRIGRYEEAAEAYQRAAKLNPELGDDLYFKLGNIAYKKRDHARARESWAQATTLNPGHQLARANLEMLDLAQ
ncbi:MAG: tetratricopeptide repeat protein [Gemmatimonadales bacterium]|nr:tetratricopeptide repeat protein [Gemmatimonadales bacterium]